MVLNALQSMIMNNLRMDRIPEIYKYPRPPAAASWPCPELAGCKQANLASVASDLRALSDKTDPSLLAYSAQTALARDSCAVFQSKARKKIFRDASYPDASSSIRCPAAGWQS